MNTQKITLALMALLISLSQILLTSCGSSNKVVSSSFIQKRKYIKGFHLNFVFRKNFKRGKVELIKEDSIGNEEIDTNVSDQDALSADNNISDDHKNYLTQEYFVPGITFTKTLPVVFTEQPLKKNESKGDTGSIIVTKRGDTIHCEILRETSVRIYYIKNEVSFSKDSASSKAEQSILRTDVASYGWDSKIKTGKPIRENLNPEDEKRKQKIARGIAIASFCCSMSATLPFWVALLSISGLIPFFLGLWILLPMGAILGVILGIVALSKIKKDPGKRKGTVFAVIGLLLGIIEIILLVLAIAALSTMSFSFSI